jgi:NitT/TauT family transport system permease protein
MKLAAALEVPRRRPEWLRFKLPSLVALLVLWQVSAMLIADPVLFPTPLATLETGYVHLMTGELLFSLAVTLARVAVAFFFAMVLGSAIGIALGRSVPMDAIFGGWLSIARNKTALVTIVIC